MGIRSLDPKEWLCLQSSYPSYAVLRAKRHQIYGERSVQILPGPVASSEAAPLSPTNPNIDQHRLAALEVARAIAWYLTNRYPSLFSAMPKGAAQRNDDGWSITSITRRDLPSTGMPEFTWRLLDEYDAQEALKAGEHVDCPMRVAGELVPDDLAIMMPESIPAADKDAFPSGVETQYRFVAGSICTAGFWRMSDKIGLTLSDIHTSGNVPQYNTKLRAPMERFFSKLRPEKPVERNNYFFQVLATKKPAEVKDMTELSWSHSTNGPETMYDMVAKGPSPAALASSNSLPFTPPTPTQDPERVVMRTERQTLRRMPRSNCILFTIRTYLVPLTTMVEEPGVPARLASAIRSWPDDVQFYKGAELYKETVLPYLDDKADLQRRNGIESRQDDELVESARKNYPF
ncbi:hypothetical protein BCV70DRAFT_166146 [Testicularia cyperi]|uniref:Uncharacterized protein n=1 Tax=Testicularia cyperi TaxID=1882483 RepID=A0A317XIX4_9BASI|nr:hypothetical protein BCV70DRAFT_166146 [Testicularia cyperi]